MRIKRLIILPALFLVFLLTFCSSAQTVIPTEPVNQGNVNGNVDNGITGTNFRFTAVNYFIDSPDRDGRVFFRIFINKQEYGRTTTGLQSQRKTFETTLPVNRHLLHVEKWVLSNDEFVRANNILQPRPDFVYFEIVANRVTNVVLSVNEQGRYEFSIR